MPEDRSQRPGSVLPGGGLPPTERHASAGGKEAKARKRKRSRKAPGLPTTARRPRTRAQTLSTLSVSEGQFGENVIEAFRIAHSQLITDAKSCLSRCIKDHVREGQCLPCTCESPRFLPTRLIDLKNLTIPRLVISSEIQDGDRQYVCLSHQWGSPDPCDKQAMVTTKDNFDSRRERINLLTLPKRYQDSMILCYLMGVKFIWIDSLCIIQDSPEDWRTESAVMGQVYECGLFTIASNMFLESQAWKAPPPPSPGIPRVIVPASSNSLCNWLITMLREGPLSRRAWCLQEQYLSPRLLHIFAGLIWIWECNSQITATAGNSLGHIKRPVSSTEYEAWGRHQRLSNFYGYRTMLRMESSVDRPTILRFWDIILNDYSNRALTYESDRLPALSGVASKVQQLLNSRYLAGIWECDLQGLMWIRSERKWLLVRRNDDNVLYFWSKYDHSDNDTSSILDSQSLDQDGDTGVIPYAESQSSEDNKLAHGSYLGPSWSWVSIIGPVEIRIRGPTLVDYTATSKAGCRFSPELVRSSIVIDGDSLLGRIKKGSQITILAHLFILGSRDEIAVCFDRERHCSPRLEDYKLLIVDLNKKDGRARSLYPLRDHLAIWGLILWNANPCSQNLFSRVGVFRVDFHTPDYVSNYSPSEGDFGHRQEQTDAFDLKDFKTMDYLWNNGAISDKMEFTLI